MQDDLYVSAEAAAEMLRVTAMSEDWNPTLP